MKLLVINVGSTSLKFRLFGLDAEENELAEGRLEGIGQGSSPYSMTSASGKSDQGEGNWPDYGSALGSALDFLTSGDEPPLNGLDDLDAVGFKCVHGGVKYDGAHLIDEAVLAAMEEATLLAPVHNPPYIEAIRSIRSLLPDTPLAALFEPEFHRTIPAERRTYGVPHEWIEKYGIRRLGFHGASHRYIAERAPQLMGRDPEGLRIISCHLGGSSSVTAIRDGVSVDHSFGFTAQSGLIHGSRTGDLDPFVPLYIMEKEGLSIREMAETLGRRSGLLGLSGISSEFREVEKAAEAGNERAQLAVGAFIHGVRHYIGAFTATLGGLDALVFTGGIGERGAATREKICKGLECLGLELDADLNAACPTEGPIHSPASPAQIRAQILVIPANEEIIVARAAAAVVKSEG